VNFDTTNFRVQSFFFLGVLAFRYDESHLYAVRLHKNALPCIRAALSNTCHVKLLTVKVTTDPKFQQLQLQETQTRILLTFPRKVARDTAGKFTTNARQSIPFQSFCQKLTQPIRNQIIRRVLQGPSDFEVLRILKFAVQFDS
jgi:hypothetical protein